MAIQIYKYQSAESSPVSLKFATKCIEGRLHLNRFGKKVVTCMFSLMSHLKIEYKLIKKDNTYDDGIVLFSRQIEWSIPQNINNVNGFAMIGNCKYLESNKEKKDRPTAFRV